jgi:catechol 2,3-dioxygenase-like lactoylglutathione lyase family enzyme
VSDLPFTSIDHVQLAMPAGGEAAAEAFYSGVLGVPRVAKPAHLERRGGCWFRSGKVEIHLGVERDFRPAVKAHPALICHNYDALIVKLKAANVSVKEDFEIPETRRSHILDPFGNRIELIADRG